MKREAIAVPMGADQPIELDEKCPDCVDGVTVGGDDPEQSERGMCPECEGVGFRPTEAGRAILALVDRYRADHFGRVARSRARDEMNAHLGSPAHR